MTAFKEIKTETVLDILAKQLDIPVQTIEVSKTFEENGGNSIILLLIIRELQQLNLDAPIELFQSPNSLQDLLNFITDRATEQLKKNKLRVERFADIDQKDALINMCCRCFTETNPYYLACDIRIPTLLPFVQNLADEDSKNPLSLVVYDEDTKQYVGGAFLCNYAAGLNFAVGDPLREVVLYLSNPHQLQCEKDKFLCIALGYAEAAMSAGLHVEIFRLLFQEIVNIAKNNNFAGIVSLTAHLFTQVCEMIKLIIMCQSTPYKNVAMHC